MSTNNQADFNIDQLLDMSLDDLADAPEFRPFPVGTHRIVLSYKDKTAVKDRINGHPAYELRMKLLETMELANPEDPALAPGSEDSVLYMMDNPLGQGGFKKVLSAIGAHIGESNIRKILENVNGMECVVVTKLRANKDKTKSYTDIVELMVV